MVPSFLRYALRNPRLTGAVAPSSEKLSREMASLAGKADCIIELGAGTGNVTAQLVPMMAKKEVKVVEVNPDMARHLRKRFPGLDVIEAPAHDVLDGFKTKAPVVLVSSIPFKVLPKTIKHCTVQSVLDFLTVCPHSRLIQYTYGVSPPFSAPEGFEWKRVRWVLGNVPPACVWALRALKLKPTARQDEDSFIAAGLFPDD